MALSKEEGGSQLPAPQEPKEKWGDKMAGTLEEKEFVIQKPLSPDISTKRQCFSGQGKGKGAK